MASNRFSVARTKGQVQDPTQVPAGIDVNTFFFPVIPDEIRSIVPLFHSTAPAIVQRISEVVTDYLCASTLDYTLPNDFYESLASSNSNKDAIITNDMINALVTATYCILRTALRNKVKLSVFRENLQKMNIPASTIDSLAQQLQSHRASFEARVIHHRLTFPKLERVRWRVDVVISSGSLTRVMRPNIVLQVSLII